MATDQDDLWDITQAAQFLQVSETSLRRWTNSGRLVCLRVGGRRERRFRRADLLAFLEEQPARASARDHVCGLYASDGGRVNLAVDFLAEGFRPGNVSYLAAAADAHDQIVADLERRRPSLHADIEAGRLVISEYPASGRAQEICDYWETHFAAAIRAGAQSLRVVGDVSGGLAFRLARQEIVDYELCYEELSQRFPVPTLCLYDVRHSSGLDVLDIFKCHQDLLRHPVDRVFS